jgi:hypothetical protein
MSIATSFVFLLCLWVAKPAAAQNVTETTYVKRDGPTIVVRTIGPVKVVKVEPYIDAKKGKQIGKLNLQVVIKNTAREPHAYQLFGQGRTGTGGWLGGSTKAPNKGQLDPGKEATAKVQTRYEGKSLPDEIRLDVF